MAATGYTPIYLYYSSTTGHSPAAGNLGSGELAINIVDKNLFFKDSTNAVNTVPIRQSSTSSDGWLSSTNWNTFNGKQDALVSGTNIKTVGGAGLLGAGDAFASANFTFGGASNGIYFNNGSSALFNDYELGTYTPTWTGLTTSGSVVSNTGTYVKVGRLVYYRIALQYSTSIATTQGSTYHTLPYNVSTAGANLASNVTNAANIPGVGVITNATSVSYVPTVGATNNLIIFSGTYIST